MSNVTLSREENLMRMRQKLKEYFEQRYQALRAFGQHELFIIVWVGLCMAGAMLYGLFSLGLRSRKPLFVHPPPVSPTKKAAKK